jgi:hypothetical protein
MRFPFYAFSIYAAIRRNATPAYNESPVQFVFNLCVKLGYNGHSKLMILAALSKASTSLAAQTLRSRIRIPLGTRIGVRDFLCYVAPSSLAMGLSPRPGSTTVWRFTTSELWIGTGQKTKHVKAEEEQKKKKKKMTRNFSSDVFKSL